MLSTVPLYRVGMNPTERHSSITNWLNSGARSSSASSSGSAASVATGTSACIANGWLSATSTPSGSSRNNSDATVDGASEARPSPTSSRPSTSRWNCSGTPTSTWWISRSACCCWTSCRINGIES